jgi:hypothetical protein
MPGVVPGNESAQAVEAGNAAAATGGVVAGANSTQGNDSIISNPLSGLEGVAKILSDIGSGLTDGKMWRSLGWIALGLLLMLGAGFALAKKDLPIPQLMPFPV